MRKIALSVAHSRLSPSIINGFSEYALSLSLSLFCYEVLSKKHHVIIFDKSMFEKGTSYSVALSKNIAQINSFAPDIAVEQHFNAAKNTGDYSLVLHSSSITSKSLAEKVSAEYSNSLATIDRHLLADAKDPRYSGDAFIYKTNCPAIITEPIFLDNKRHALYIESKDNLMKIAVCLIRGIDNYFKTDGDC